LGQDSGPPRESTSTGPFQTARMDSTSSTKWRRWNGLERMRAPWGVWSRFFRATAAKPVMNMTLSPG